MSGTQTVNPGEAATNPRIYMDTTNSSDNSTRVTGLPDTSRPSGELVGKLADSVCLCWQFEVRLLIIKSQKLLCCDVLYLYEENL